MSAAGGAAGRRLPVTYGGRRVAAAVSLCRPRWLMDWTGADEHVTAADRTTARRVCAAGRAADNPRLAAHGRANSQGWRQNKFE